MRPIRKGPSPINGDFTKYRDAFPYLASRLGTYCSYCERRLQTMLHVEHIQPKSLPAYEHLEGRWDNFLLSCVNCNSPKGTTDVIINDYLLPDRDNTSAAFIYHENGHIDVSQSLGPAIQAKAHATLRLVGLNRTSANARSSNELLVALDRISQRREVWLQAVKAKEDISSDPENDLLVSYVIKLALQTGFFSVWMEVLGDDAALRSRLIDAFPGTRESGCFDAQNSNLVQPAPNPDHLAHGGKA
jgi:uncharacterized protein (TIGR02646 family)